MLRAVQAILARHDADLDIQPTQHAGHGAELARLHAPHVEAVLVAGGDGTLCEVANGLAGSAVPVCAFGAGTENLMARVFRMPQEPAGLATALLQGERVPCDVGTVNDRRFLAVVGVGFDAEVVSRLVRVRRGHIDYLNYFWPIWRTFWSHRFPRLVVHVDGVRVFAGRGLAILGNIWRYSLGLPILQHAQPSDGLLDLCIFPTRSRSKLLVHAVNVLARRHVGRAGSIYAQGKRITIDSPDRVPIEVDGDEAGYLPIECTVHEHGLTLLR